MPQDTAPCPTCGCARKVLAPPPSDVIFASSDWPFRFAFGNGGGDRYMTEDV